MSGIPLPALDIKPPQQPDMMGDVSKLMALRSMMGQQQVQQQQIQAGGLENQQRQMDVKDQQNMRTLAPQFMKKDESGKPAGFDADGYYGALMGAGVSPAKIAAMQKAQNDAVLSKAQAGSAALKLEDDKNDQAYQIGEGVRSIKDPAQQQAAYQAAIPKLQALGVNVSQFGPQYPGDEGIKSWEVGLGVHKQIIADAKTQADTAHTATETALNQNKLEVIKSWKENPQQVLSQVDAIVPPGGANATLNARTKSQVQFALGNGDVDGAKAAIKQAAEQVGAIEKDIQEKTNPAIQNAEVAMARRKKMAEQAITQGDPAAAGKLLADGSLTLSELKSRGTTPQFIVQATQAAQQANPGYNPQKAEADLGVAKSPANLAFFGSAKSLTDPGGTLDQLAAVAKDIPDGQIPAFNSIADVMKASVGSGPIAKYATVLLGVADDYSKVMGGGQGSDTSRTQALNLVPAKGSPEARDAAIQGIRGAVGSQITSRIGNNTVLKRMYGQAQPQQQGGGQGGTPAGATHTAMGSDGKKHYTNAQGQDLGVAQ